MWIHEKIFFNKKPDIQKLTAHGFEEQNGIYTYTTTVMDNTFQVTVLVAGNGETDVKVIDIGTNEEYVLVHMKHAVGEFVGRVRTECDRVLEAIVSACFVTEIFKSDDAKKIIRYVKETYGADPEFLWEKTPNNAVFREPDSQKWYAALLTVQKEKVGIAEEGEIEIIDLRGEPEQVALLVDGIHYLPGYHMNKKYWYTIRLDGSVDIEEIFRCIDASYQTLPKGKGKKSK